MSLNYMDVEVSYGTTWISLNDHERFVINASETRDQASKSYRKVTADSMVLGGTYLVHAVPDMVTERVGVWVYGQDQSDLADNYFFLIDIFEQMDYRIRWTFEDYREYWRCQLADSVSSRGQVWTHNTMAGVSFNVPRWPDVSRERVL